MRKCVWLFAVISIPALGQRTYDNNVNSWLVYSGDHSVKGKWGVHLEGQWRRHEFVRAQQLLLRPAVNYQLTSKMMVAAGYGWVSTHRYGDFPTSVPFPEHRLYQQFLVNQSAKGNDLQHRLRLEQRWIGLRFAMSEGTRFSNGWRYQNRIRYMFRFVRPLGEKWYFATYDEIKFNLPPFGGARGFDQNRAFVGGGYRMNSYNRLEIGYLQQTLLQRNARIMELDHTVHVSIYSTIPFRR